MRYITPELLLIGAAQILVQNVQSQQRLCSLDNPSEYVSKDPGEW